MLGNLVGSWIAYAVGYYGRLDLLEKNKLIHISPKHLKWADDWFERYGDATVFFSRMLPIIRTFISLPAGVAKMPFWRFTAYTAARLASPGCWRWPWSAKRSATTGKTGATNSATSTTWSLAAIVVGVVYCARQAAARRRVAARTSDRAAAEPSRPVPGALERSRRIPARRAVALGLVQGPAELLPVSSSAHIVLVPWLAGWDWEEVDPEVRKSFEVALHTGAAAALLIGQRRLIAEELRAFDGRRALLLGLSFLPAAIVGYTLERPIERRLGGPRATAYGLLAGAAAMLVADRRPQRRGPRRRDADRRPRARRRPGGGACPGRLPQRRHPGGGPLAPLLPRPGEPALAHDRAADHRRRHRASRAPASPAAAPPPELRRSLGDRRRRLLRLDPRLPAPDPAGRARPRALALCGLPGRLGGRGSGQAAR